MGKGALEKLWTLGLKTCSTCESGKKNERGQREAWRRGKNGATGLETQNITYVEEAECTAGDDELFRKLSESGKGTYPQRTCGEKESLA